MENNNSKNIINFLSISNLTAQFSEQMAIAAIPILAVVALSVSAEQSAALQAICTLPFLLLSIPAGILADRFRRKNIMILVELVRSAALFFLFVVIYMHVLSYFALAALGFAIATGTVVYSVAAPALVATFVGKENLLTANRRLEIARSIAFTAGPSVGGILAAWSSGVFAFLTAFFLSIASVWYLAKLPSESRSVSSKRRILTELSEGIIFIARNQYLRPIIFTAFVFNISWYLLLAIFAYYVINYLDFSAPDVGVALSIYGFGMIAGAFLYKPIFAHLKFGRQILVGPICAAFAAIFMTMTIFAHSRSIVFIAFFLFGFGPIIWTISTTSLRQIVTPGELIARVSSFIITATFGARPLGALIGVWLSATFGVASCLVGVTVGFLIQLGIIFLSAPARLSSIEDLSADTETQIVTI